MVDNLNIFEEFIQEYKEVYYFTNIEDYSIKATEEYELIIQTMQNDKESVHSFIQYDLFSIANSNSFLINKDKFKTKKVQKLVQKMIKVKKELRHCNNNSKFDNDTSNRVLILLNNLSNLLLIGCSDFLTLYNMKKDYIESIIKSREDNDKSRKNLNSQVIESLITEIKFIDLVSLKNRKSSMSWDYRIYIFRHIINILLDKTNDIKEDRVLNSSNFELINKFNKDHHTFISIFFNSMDKLNEIIENNYLLFLLNQELYYLFRINNQESRNYYVWKYLLLIKNTIFDFLMISKSNENKNSSKSSGTKNLFSNVLKLLFVFGFSLIGNNNKDYSAYHFVKNLIEDKKLNSFSKDFIREEVINEEIRHQLIEYLNLIIKEDSKEVELSKCCEIEKHKHLQNKYYLNSCSKVNVECDSKNKTINFNYLTELANLL